MNKNVFQKFQPKAKEFTDSGLSNQVSNQSKRLINPDGTFNIRRTGRHPLHELSIAHSLISMSWPRYLLWVSGFYITVNLIFALAYYWIGMEDFMGVVASNKLEEFREAFFFSAQTLTTVGFGRLNPLGFWVNAISTLEALVGLLTFAIVTGLMYGRFARAVAHLIFSTNALISPYKDINALMFRVANAKNNDMSDVEVQVLLSLVVFEDNRFIRRYYGLELERKSINALSLSWTIVHPIDEKSPLYGFTPQMCEEFEAEILVTIKGFDPTFSQTVQTRTSYHYSSFVWNAKFRPAFRRSEDGHDTILALNELSHYDLLPAKN